VTSRIAKFLFGGLIGAGVLAVMFSAGEQGTQAQNRKVATPAQLVPENAVLFANIDGPAKHKDALEKTAMHDAIYKSGLADVVEKLIMSVANAHGLGGAIEGPLAQVGEHFNQHGVMLSISLHDSLPNAPALPQVQFIFPEAAVFGKQIDGLLQNLPLPINNREVNGRSVNSIVIPNSPGVEIGFWVEGKHLVLVAGIGAVDAHLAVAAGESKNVTQGAAWAKYGPQTADFDLTASFWIDAGQLAKTYGAIPLPVPGSDGEPLTVNYFLDALGFDNLGVASVRSGYKGRAVWSESVLEVKGNRNGLIALGDQPSITLADLPALPADTSSFLACSFDFSTVYTKALAGVKKFVSKAPERVQEDVDQTIKNIPIMLGFDPKKDLFDALGNVACVYVDSSQDFMGAGIAGAVAAIEVKDNAKLQGTLKHIFSMIEAMSGGDFTTNSAEKNGINITTFQVESVEIGAVAVTDDWLLVSLTPQSIITFQMRADGKLPKWKPNGELQQAFASLPKEFTSLTISDPRPIYRQLMSLAPFLMTGAKAALIENRLVPRGFEFDVSVADVPPSELVTAPLFPNVSMSVNGKDGLKHYSRSSIPSIPLIGGGGGGSSITTVAVLVALVLPAVQQAREAARRSQSRNNMKQLGLAMHNHHEVFRSLPSGTIENKDLKVEERLSWVISLLPFLDQNPLAESIDKDQAWDSDANSRSTKTIIPTLLNPQVAAPPLPNGARIDYVAMAGVGVKAPTLPVNDPKAGVFGYDRKTRFRDIKDGTSNTIGVTEASKDFGNWAQGGKSTIRSLTKKPYVNGPDGIGSPFRGGMNVLLMDGSVRFISENIDAGILEALMTIAGRENIRDF
jgi:hypothetical protein